MGRRNRHLMFCSKSLGASISLYSPSIAGKSNDDLIDSWNDLSGNANNAVGTGTQRPTYKTSQLKGFPVVSFNGISNFLKGGKVANVSTTNTFIGVGKITGGSTHITKNIGAFCLLYNDTNNVDYFGPYYNGGLNWRLYSGANLDCTASFPQNTYGALRAISNSTNSSVAVNGISNSGNAGSLDSNNSNSYILSRWPAGNQFHQWDIGYCGIWGGVILSSSMLKRIECSLALTFGITR
jgi:hypothetical protein